MKRLIALVGLSLALVLVISLEAKAQGKAKKGKEPELAISKRGKLIFEDDFSGDDLQWKADRGDWKIVKKTLVIK